MSFQINQAACDELLDKILPKFAANFTATNNSEVIERAMFVKNFTKGLNSIDLENEDNVAEFNEFVEGLKNYEIVLMDIFQVCGTNEIPNMMDVIRLFNTLKNGGYRVDHACIEKIYVSLISEQDKAIADVLNMLKSVDLHKYQFYIKPHIKYSYIKSNEYFINIADVYKDFYSNTSIANVINTPLVFNNAELNSLYDYIRTSYASKNFLLLDIGQTKPYHDFLKFILNFQFDESYIIQRLRFFGMTWTLNIDPQKSLEHIFANNVFICDKNLLLFNLAKDIYKPYMNDMTSYYFKDLPFEVNRYISKLYVEDYKKLQHTNFKYNLFKATITGQSSDMINYSGEVAKLRDYIQNIYTTVLTDSRYSLEG